MDSTIYFEDLYQLLYVSSFGCNRRCAEEIKKIFYYQNREPLYFFYEFFVNQPLPKKTEELFSRKKKCEKWEESVYLFAPFASRLAENAFVIPKDENSMAFRNLRDFQKFKLMFRWDCVKNTKYAYDKWKDPNGSDIFCKPQEIGHISEWKTINDFERKTKYLCGIIEKWNWNWQKETYTNEIMHPETKKNSLLLAQLYRPLLVGKESDNVNGIFLPIASSNLFFGAIWIMFPGLYDCDSPEEPINIMNEVGLKVSRLIQKIYLPSLALIHEHWLEKNIYGKAENRKEKNNLKAEFEVKISDDKIFYRNVFFNCIEPQRSDKNSGLETIDLLEKLFVQLWNFRGKILKEKNDGFEESLIFKKYLICSETMMKLLHQVIISSRKLSKISDTLPACLIVGGPGSGKDKLAKMLRIFSHIYRYGEEYTINMAAIRPSPLTSALIAGIEVDGTFNFKLKGILEKIVKTKQKQPPTIILDEFNSMDSDSQGVLLRFLDNSEIIPIGAVMANKIKNDDVNCLVLGVMNEDPHEISRERSMEFLKKGNYLGDFIGDIMYEHFLKNRRLRPDVMYRMIRNGKFVIPFLRERRLDIPLLFYVFVYEELEESIKVSLREAKVMNQHCINGEIRKVETKFDLFLPISIMNRLVSAELSWPGNIRQLQALAKLVSERLLSLQKKDEDGLFIVTQPILEDSLTELGLVKDI